MANKQFLLAVSAAVLAFGIAAAGCDTGTGGGNGSEDVFTGTWASTGSSAVKITASGGSYKGYLVSSGKEIQRGTYTVSGNTVTAKMTEVNTAMFGGADTWTAYADLSADYKSYLNNSDTFQGTIGNNKITFNGQEFTKQ